jgi:hypothetical protein
MKADCFWLLVSATLNWQSANGGQSLGLKPILP